MIRQRPWKLDQIEGEGPHICRIYAKDPGTETRVSPGLSDSEDSVDTFQRKVRTMKEDKATLEARPEIILITETLGFEQRELHPI
ncbi:hypothetical protein QTO34_000594 [Cnephaeus nilssonii]|uniref:Uncharacterized protein n=1 Tax=Cnephaeus nilssonii TaxID=3371016 RepID=A0AA40IBP7_CNENI|nr:hypothetical protein QTO34_000594 [Eptesicus nilssonii]